MRDDKKTWRTMAVGFVLICLCCAFMQRMLVKKGNMYLERSKPRYNLEKKDQSGEMRDGVGSVTGEVSAVSYDKFFLKLPDGKLQGILRGELASPKVGSKIEVTYAGGTPPKALMISVAASQ